jgi:ankyrin repeat protein
MILVENGAELNSTNKRGVTPLQLAAARRHLEVVKYLVDKGADVNKADRNGSTPLMMATGSKDGNKPLKI